MTGGASPIKFFLFFPKFFAVYILPLPWVKAAYGKGFAVCLKKRLTAKLALPADICRVLFAACYTWLSLCRVHKGLCRMPQANFFAIVF